MYNYDGVFFSLYEMRPGVNCFYIISRSAGKWSTSELNNFMGAQFRGVARALRSYLKFGAFLWVSPFFHHKKYMKNN